MVFHRALRYSKESHVLNLFSARLNFFRQMSLSFWENLESNKKKINGQEKKKVFSLAIHCGLVAYVVNWALSFNFKIFAYGWSLTMKGLECLCCDVTGVLHSTVSLAGAEVLGQLDLCGLELSQKHQSQLLSVRSIGQHSVKEKVVHQKK